MKNKPLLKLFLLLAAQLPEYFEEALRRARETHGPLHLVEKAMSGVTHAEVGGYLRLRTWTFRNSLKAAGWLYELPVLALIALSVLFQTLGYMLESRRQGKQHELAE